jgi:hypothetical protein
MPAPNESGEMGAVHFFDEEGSADGALLVAVKVILDKAHDEGRLARSLRPQNHHLGLERVHAPRSPSVRDVRLLVAAVRVGW